MPSGPQQAARSVAFFAAAGASIAAWFAWTRLRRTSLPATAEATEERREVSGCAPWPAHAPQAARPCVVGLHILDLLGVSVAAYLEAVEVWTLRSVAADLRRLAETWVRSCDGESVSSEEALFKSINPALASDVHALGRVLAYAWSHQQTLRSVDCAGRTLLMKAAQLGQARCIRALLTARAAPSARSRAANGWTALHFAAVSGHEEACESLLQRRADVNVRSCDGYPALFYAHRAGEEGIAGLLRRYGAIPCSAGDRWGFTDTCVGD